MANGEVCLGGVESAAKELEAACDVWAVACCWCIDGIGVVDGEDVCDVVRLAKGL